MRIHVVPSGIPEPARKPRETPAAYAVRAARLKAEEVAGRYRTGIILGADTIVVLGDDILGKPSSREEARGMLIRLSGRWHEVISGMCLFRCKPRSVCSSFGRSRVHFRGLSSAEVDWYLRTGEYRDKAGAYGAQGFASLFIDRIEGCYFNVVGFPVTVFERLCRKMGINLIEELIRDSGFGIRD
jgi:septum formation protein